MADTTTLRELITKWRKSGEQTRAEFLTIRRDYQEGPRYGIAAVESCADDLEQALASLGVAEADPHTKADPV